MKRFLTFILIIMSVFAMTGCGSKERLEAQEAYKTLGMNALNQGEYKESIENFDKALSQSLGKVTGKEIEINYYKAIALFLSEDYDSAIDIYTNVIEFMKNDPDPYFLRGSVYLRKNKLNEALEDYRTAVKLSELDYEMYIAVYNNLSALGYDSQAKEFIDEALSINKKNAAAFLARGRIYLLLGQYDEASEQLQTAREKGAKEAAIYLAEVYQATGAKDAARELLSSYLTEAEASAEALSVMSTLSIDNGDYTEALTYVNRALAMEKVTNQQALLRNKIICEEYLGDYKAAYKSMKEYRALYPSDPDASREYEFIKTRYEGMAGEISQAPELPESTEATEATETTAEITAQQ